MNASNISTHRFGTHSSSPMNRASRMTDGLSIQPHAVASVNGDHPITANGRECSMRSVRRVALIRDPAIVRPFFVRSRPLPRT